MKNKIIKTDDEWRKILTPEQFRVLRTGGTECAFTGKYSEEHGAGIFICAGCGKTLFRSKEKFESGTGWPSFFAPVDRTSLIERTDRTHGMERTEVLCGCCDGHLGHVFNDGPVPTGLRYCINSAALIFKPEPPASSPGNGSLETATFGAGCFWCTEAAFQMLDGVKSVEVGYMGGKTRNPTYKEICAGKTGHAEVSQVKFDPALISYGKLLEVFWKIHDPTSLNRQGEDAGTQYRSVIFYHTPAQKETAEKSREALQKQMDKKIVTEISPATEFYKAEDYHQDYYKNNSNAPYCRAVIAPKLKKLEHYVRPGNP